MSKSDRNPGRRQANRFGRALALLIGLPVLLIGAVLAVALLMRSDPAVRAYQSGVSQLAAGNPAEAAERFREAVALDPALEAAWHGLLDADPSPVACRQFAQHMPQLFDDQQPLPDDRLLVVGQARDLERWQQTTERYLRVAAPADGSTSGDDHELIRLDYEGRIKVRAAWDIARRLHREMSVLKRGGWSSENPMPFQYLTPFARYDLKGIALSIQKTAAYFRETREWMEALKSIGNAIRLEAEGLAQLKQAEALRPTFLPTQLTLAYVAIGRGRPDEAARRCRTLLEAMPGQDASAGVIRTRYALARALDMAGQLEPAAEQLEAVLAVHPSEFQALEGLGLIYLRLGQIDKAEAIADELAKGSQLDKRPARILGMVHYHRGRYRDAVVELTTAHMSQPYNAEVHFTLARSMFEAGEYMSASREFMRVALQNTDAAMPMAAAAVAALSAGHGKTAREAAEILLAQQDWLESNPKAADFARRLHLAGSALEGRAAFSVEAAETLLEGTEDRAGADGLVAGIWAAEAYVTARQPVQVGEEKLAFFRESDRPSARYALAFLLAAGGDLPGARRELAALLAEHPGEALAALHLARLDLLDGKTERAARTLQHDRLDPRIPAIARTLRTIDRLQGLRIPREIPTLGDDPIGPHLAFFTLTVPDDNLAYAQLLVLLDPVGSQALEMLEMAYARIRTEGLQGLVEAGQDNRSLNFGVQHGLARHLAEVGRGTGLSRLAAGRFWEELRWQP